MQAIILRLLHYCVEHDIYKFHAASKWFPNCSFCLLRDKEFFQGMWNWKHFLEKRQIPLKEVIIKIHFPVMSWFSISNASEVLVLLHVILPHSSYIWLPI